MYRKLIISGIETDLPTDFNPSFTYEVNDDGVIICARAKRSINLPSTTTNDTLFEDWGSVATSNPNAPAFKDFTFENGGVTIFAGKAQLQDADLISNRYRFKAAGYNVDLYGTNADWFFLLKDTKLSDFSYTDVIYSTAAAISGWVANYDFGDESGFTLVKWKEWQTPGQVDIDEFTPFLFIRTLLDKAFDSIGYNIISNFLDTENFKKLILLTPLPSRYNEAFSQDYLNVKLSQAATNTASTSNTYIFPTYQQPIINAPYNAATGFYVVPFSGYYEVEIFASVASTIGVWAAYFSATINGSFIPMNGSIVSFGWGLLAPPLSGNAQGIATSNVYFLNAGDTISLLHLFSGTDPSTTFEFSMNIRGEAETGFGSLVAFKYLVQDWKVSDMIKGLQHMFNLRFEADVERQTITIEPADDYLYRNRATPEVVLSGFYQSNLNELGQNIDLSVPAKLYSENEQPQIFQYTYITEGDTEEYLDQNNALGFFAGQYTLPENKYNSATETRENPFFAKTLSENDNELMDITSQVNVQIPLIYPQNYILDPTAIESNTQVQPRILYFAGFRGADGIINYSFLGAPLTYALSFMTNYAQPLDWSISFATETVQGQSIPGLLESFYLQEFARKRIAKRAEIAYFWDSLQMSSLSFRNKVLLDGVEYVLQRIDGYKPLEDSSTLTVIRVDEVPSSEDVDALAGGDVIGVANLTV